MTNMRGSAAVLLVLAVGLVMTAGTCLAAPGPITVTKKLIDSPLDDIQWADSHTVFVLSEQGVVYRSPDGGATWTNIQAKLKSSGSSPTIRSLHVSPCDPNTLFLLGHGSENWLSTDMGASFVKQEHELNLHEVKLHPTQNLWMLGGTMSDGCDEVPRSHCHKVMWVTKDGGKTWNDAVSYAVQFDWAPPLKKRPKTTPQHPVAKYKAPKPQEGDNLVYATVHEAKRGNQEFGSWDAGIHMYESYDFFSTEHMIVRYGNRFLFGDFGFLFVAAVNPRQENEVALRVSKDTANPSTGVRRHDFRTALLPVELTEHSYTILDTSSGSVFLHVNHAPFHLNAPTGHVYISDATGTQYSLSLPYNHRSGEGKADFDKIESMEGIYIANFIDESDEYGEVWTGDAQEDDSIRSSRRSETKTVITFDQGAIWSYLEPPSRNAKGEKLKCASSECHLHLHAVTSLYGPVYSTASATGIILGTGTVGSHLEENLDRINTYMSRDAGLTWLEIAQGSHIYEIADHGSLIVMAYDEGETDRILYSWDEGLTWQKYKISETPIQVENIIVEPEAKSLKLVIYGWSDDSGVLVYIDFTELHQRQCQGHDAPNSESSDYELWTPSDGRLGGACLMGHKTTYTRRKREKACYNPEGHERAVEMEHCPCTENDFQCSYGYYRKLEGGPCIRDTDVVDLPETPPDVCDDFYTISRGYQRVAGDTCVGGERWDPTQMPCPGWLGGSSFGKLVIGLLLLLVVGMGASTLYGKSEFVEDCVDSIRSKFQKQDYWQVGGKEMPHSMADDEFGIDAPEYEQQLMRGGGDGDDDDDDDDESFRPLPERTSGRRANVPRLSGPPAGGSDDELLDF